MREDFASAATVQFLEKSLKSGIRRGAKGDRQLKLEIEMGKGTTFLKGEKFLQFVAQAMCL